MNVRLESASRVPDGIKWLVALALLAGALVAFYYYEDVILVVRVVGLLVLCALAALVAVQTEKGRVAWEFVRDSRTEVRKVVWPTRKETVQTTGIVIMLVAILGIILWMVDGLFGWLVRLLLGGGG